MVDVTEIQVCEGQAGVALYINNERVAGPRHNGLMTTLHQWKVPNIFARHRDAAKREAMLEAARIAEGCMKLISIGVPGTGPFTRDDQVVDEVTATIAKAIRDAAGEVSK